MELELIFCSQAFLISIIVHTLLQVTFIVIRTYSKIHSYIPKECRKGKYKSLRVHAILFSKLNLLCLNATTCTNMKIETFGTLHIESTLPTRKAKCSNFKGTKIDPKLVFLNVTLCLLLSKEFYSIKRLSKISHGLKYTLKLKPLHKR